MENQFTTLDFPQTTRGCLAVDEASLLLAASSQCLTFNRTISEELLSKGFTSAEIVKNNYTGEHFIVFNKERKGILLTKAGSEGHFNIRINNKKMAIYLRIIFKIPASEKRTVLKIGKNLAPDENIMTFKLSKDL